MEQHFDTAFSAPDGIAKLRELILTLAMQGKLVPQDPNDPPASELLKEIEIEKQRLVDEKKIKKPKLLPPIKLEEVPYALPEGWEWVRVRDIGHDWGQKIPNVQFTYIDVGAINNKQGSISGDTQILNASSAPSRARKIVKPGTVIYSTVRPYLLNIAVIEKKYDPEPIVSTAFAVVHPLAKVNAQFIYYYFRSPVFIRYVESTQKGVAYPAINDGDFFSGLFPLPPLSEQHRIVTRIDQLMARCDELEKLRKEREEMRLKVHAAAIKQLLDAPENAGWLFIQKHFGELYTVKENVAELRKAILQLAVMGRLVPQDSNDPPASELLKEIEAEKQRLVEEKKIKKPKSLPPIKPEEVPYELPRGWEWVRLGNLNPEYQNGISKRGSSDGCETIVLRLADIVGNEVSLDNTRSIQLTEKELYKYLLNDGDVLITRVNGSVDLVGSFIRIGQIQRPIAYCDHFIRMKLPLKFTDVDYLHVISKGVLVRRQIEGKFVTTAGQKTVNQSHINTLVLPFPPLAEQHRIVARIDQLMALCDTLEQQIEAASCKQSALLNSVMAQV
ncbi:hypothetical protein HW44_15755 [Nitrosococcus oceani]|nr:hypothetical protein HW44_15755 [Nitrosococcus oceani]